MNYPIAGILSVCLIGGTAFAGYFLFNWVFAKQNVWALCGIYVSWLIALFLLAFTNGRIGHALVAAKGDSSFGTIVGIAWACVAVGMAIYLWFKQPYTVGFVVPRAIGTLFSVKLAVFLFLMVALMSTKQ